jgi:Fe-S-cluster containining protein
MSEERAAAEAILRDHSRMGLDDSFVFRCDKSLDCFTRCCRDVSIVLTPYDVLRMTRALGIESSDFLERYTICPFTSEQKIPVLLLKMCPETRTCPFVGEAGCSLYADRPWACRMYPLGLAEPDKPTAADHAFHFLVREEICRGHNSGRTLTVREWMADQKIEEYEMMAAPFKELMLHPFWNGDRSLSPEQIQMYYMACFDLDRFRRFVFESRLLQLFDVDESRVDAMRTDDVELLDFAMQWLRFSLFHERSMKVKPSIIEARRRAGADARQGIHG